jgi:phytoene/squalene synthetase
MPVDRYETFPVASFLLSGHLRRPVEIICAFARSADDFADEGNIPNGWRRAWLDNCAAELDRIKRGEASALALFSSGR